MVSGEKPQKTQKTHKNNKKKPHPPPTTKTTIKKPHNKQPKNPGNFFIISSGHTQRTSYKMHSETGLQ